MTALLVVLGRRLLMAHRAAQTPSQPVVALGHAAPG